MYTNHSSTQITENALRWDSVKIRHSTRVVGFGVEVEVSFLSAAARNESITLAAIWAPADTRCLTAWDRTIDFFLSLVHATHTHRITHTHSDTAQAQLAHPTHPNELCGTRATVTATASDISPLDAGSPALRHGGENTTRTRSPFGVFEAPGNRTSHTNALRLWPTHNTPITFGMRSSAARNLGEQACT